MSNKGFGYNGRIRVLIQLAKTGFLPEFKYLPRYLSFYLAAFMLAPLKLFERLMVNKRISRHRMKEDPVFIIGHMRSGTTHLHNLLSKDPSFSFPTTFQTHSPEFYMYGKPFVAPFFELFVPEKRPMDNMTVSLDLPQEEEFAVAAMCPHSFYFHMLFPKKANYFFERNVLDRDPELPHLKEWEKNYDHVIRKFSLTGNSRRLVLKNPVNTARSGLLLTMYPKASFIFIHRDPYEVFLSTRNLYRKVLPLCQLQNIAWEDIDQMILRNYVALLKRYFEDRKSIPDHQLIEISHKELETHPLETLEKIYTQLGFKHYNDAMEHFTHYLYSQKDYEKNSFHLEESDIILVNQYCEEIFNKLGYSMIDQKQRK